MKANKTDDFKKILSLLFSLCEFTYYHNIMLLLVHIWDQLFYYLLLMQLLQVGDT